VQASKAAQQPEFSWSDCMISINALTSIEEGLYESWLLSIENSMVYYAPAFHRFLQSTVGGEKQILVARRGPVITGALPLFIKKDCRYGAIANSLPWYGSHGGCVLADLNDDESRRVLLHAFCEKMHTEQPLSSTMIVSPMEEQARKTYEEVVGPNVTDHRIGQITELPLPGEGLEQRVEAMLQQKTRNLVRKARKQQFSEVVTDEEWAWQFLIETHTENIIAIGGKPKPAEHFSAIRKELPSSMRRLAVALLEGKPVAAMLLLLFNRTVEYITPAICHTYRPLQPLSFLIWNAMIVAINSGFRWWNWGGTWTNQQSLHHFKAGWGAVDRPYTYLIKAQSDFIKSLNHESAKIFEAFPHYYIYPFNALQGNAR